MNLAFMNTKSISATKCFATKITGVYKNTREMDGFKVIFHFGLSIRCVFTQSTLKVFGIWNRCDILFQVLNVLGQTCETEISSLILFRMSEGRVHSKSIPALECLSTQITAETQKRQGNEASKWFLTLAGILFLNGHNVQHFLLFPYLCKHNSSNLRDSVQGLELNRFCFIVVRQEF